MTVMVDTFETPRASFRADLKAAALPLLVPVDAPEREPRVEQEPAIRFSSASIINESTDFRDREERKEVCARLTVYAATAILMFISFPIGFALLIFNILGGENLRTTFHAIALTGGAQALMIPGFGMGII